MAIPTDADIAASITGGGQPPVGAPSAAPPPASSIPSDADISSSILGPGEGAHAAAPAKPAAAAPPSGFTPRVLRTIAGEAASPEGQKAVASVILKRAQSSGLTPDQIVQMPLQFEAYGATKNWDPSDPRIARAAANVAGAEAGPYDHFYGPQSQAQLAKTDGRKLRPDWDDGTGVNIGGNLFFNKGYAAPKLTLSQIAKMAAENFVPDVEHNVGSVVHAITNPGETWQGVQRLGGAGMAVANGWAGDPVDPQGKADADAIGKNVGDYIHNNYGSLDAFGRHVATAPFTTGTEVALPIGGVEAGAGKIADLAARGAEGLGDASAIGRTLGAVSDVSRGAQGVARTAGMVVDPVRALSEAVAPTTYNPTRMGGALRPEVDRAIQQATGGAMKAEDIMALPDTQRRAFLQTLREKGASPAAVNEGFLRAGALDTPRSLATGAAPPDFARQAVADSRASNTYAIGDQARALSGAEAPDASALADHLGRAQAASINKIQDGYDALAAKPGTLGHTVDGVALNNDLARGVSAVAKSPISGVDLGTTLSRSGTPIAEQVHQLINDRMVNGLHAFPTGGIDAPEMMQLRRQLTDHLRSAQVAGGEDAKYTKALVEGWQNHIDSLAKSGKFLDPSGAPVTDFMDSLRHWNNQYAEHMNTFSQGPIGNATRVLDGDVSSGRMVHNADADTQMAAQGPLARNLFHPTKGADIYNQLQKALAHSPGGQKALDDFLRQSVLHTEGGVLKPTREIGEALRTPNSAVAKAFASDPGALARARLLHANHHLSSRPFKAGTRHRSTIGGIAASLAAKGAAGYIGDQIGHLPGFLIAQSVEHGAEKALQGRRMAAEMNGVHKLGHHGLIAKGVRAAHAAVNPRSIATARATRQGHAAGGKVDDPVERLVGRLMNMAKQAKVASDATTKPLLGAPDEAIVKALAVAQKAI